jgi:hypothetical protein
MDESNIQLQSPFFEHDVELERSTRFLVESLNNNEESEEESYEEDENDEDESFTDVVTESAKSGEKRKRKTSKEKRSTQHKKKKAKKGDASTTTRRGHGKKSKKSDILSQEEEEEEQEEEQEDEEVEEEMNIEENGGRRRRRRRSNSGKRKDATHIVDEYGILEYFQDHCIYRMKKWNSSNYMSLHGAATSIDNKVLTLLKHNFYYTNFIHTSFATSTPSSTVKNDEESRIRSSYVLPPSTRKTGGIGNVINNPNSIVWHDKESTLKLKHWLKTFKLICIDNDKVVNKEIKGGKHVRYWETIQTVTTSDYIMFETTLLETMNSFNQQYLVNESFSPLILASEDYEHQQTPSSSSSSTVNEQPLLVVASSLTKKSHNVVNYERLFGVLVDVFHNSRLTGLNSIKHSLLCCFTTMDCVKKIFRLLQEKCDAYHENPNVFYFDQPLDDMDEIEIEMEAQKELYSLPNIVKRLNLSKMTNYKQFDDMLTYLNIMNFIFTKKFTPLDHQEKISRDLLVNRNDKCFHDFLSLIDNYIATTEGNLLFLAKLFFAPVSFMEAVENNGGGVGAQQLLKDFGMLIIVRYVLHFFEKKAEKLTRWDKSTLFSFKIHEIQKEISKLNCGFHIYDKVNEEFIKVSIFDDTLNAKVIAGMLYIKTMTKQPLSPNKGEHYPYYPRYSTWMLEGHEEFMARCKSGLTDSDLKTRFFIFTEMNEMEFEKRNHSLIVKFSQSLVNTTIFDYSLWENKKDNDDTDMDVTHDDDGKEEEEMSLENLSLKTHPTMSIDLIVFDSSNLIQQKDLKIFYKKYYKDNLHSTLILRPVENYYANKSLYSYFMRIEDTTSSNSDGNEEYNSPSSSSVRKIFPSHCKSTAVFTNQETKDQLSSYGYDIVFIPYAHYYSLQEYYEIMSWLDSQKHSIKKVIITGTTEIIPSLSYGQAFLDHLRILNKSETRKCICGDRMMSSPLHNTYQSFEHLFTTFWKFENSFVYTKKNSISQQQEFFHQLMTKQCLASGGGTKEGNSRYLTFLHQFGNMESFTSQFMENAFTFLQKCSNDKYSQTTTTAVAAINPLSKIQKITIHPIEEYKNAGSHSTSFYHFNNNDKGRRNPISTKTTPITTSMTSPRVSVDKIYIHDDFYKRKMNLVEQFCHIRFYVINYSYFLKLVKSQYFILFSILDNLIIINDDIGGKKGANDITTPIRLREKIVENFTGKRSYTLKSSYISTMPEYK